MLKSRASPPSALGGADIHVMIDGEWADKGRCKGWLALGTKLHGELGTKLEQKLIFQVSCPGFSAFSWPPDFQLPGPGQCPRRKYL